MEHLFARWLPQWRLAVVGGDAPPSYEEEWTAAAAPSLAEVSDYGAFPLTFAGLDGRRHPVAVERYDIEDPDATSDGPLHASWGLPDDGAEEAFTFLVEALESGPGGLDRRGRALAGYLAGYLAADGTDLLRITAAAEPGGPALDDELHMMVRSDTKTTRLALALAPDAADRALAPDASEPAPGPVAPDSSDVSDVSEHRIACTTTLLSEFLRINNTDAVTFEVTFGTYDIDLNVADPDAAFRAGWAGDEHWLIAEEGDDESAGETGDESAGETGDEIGGETDDESDDVLRSLDSATLRAALIESERNMVAVARSQTLVWEFDSTTPEIPGDELVSWLARDLVETLVTETTGAPGIPPVLAYAKNVPLESVLYGEGDACLLLVGAERTALVHISG
ncbi:hypothetical protein [Streptomyces sp. NPDC059008]|uniref:hypothetical protein n=1 Tax=Streptomyces sp. NPDC059008 TaxID=3346693 RepID=UPI0036C4156C